jgi:hypothetical protein
MLLVTCLWLASPMHYSSLTSVSDTICILAVCTGDTQGFLLKVTTHLWALMILKKIFRGW